MILERLVSFDITPKTKRNAVAVLASTLRYADVSPNPCDNIRIKRGQKPPILRYRPEEVAQLLSKLNGAPLAYFTIMAATGMRPGEILALEWPDWNGERLSVSKQIVRRRLVKTTKTSVRRTVYVPQWARQTINEQPTRFSGSYIFQNATGSHHLDTDVFNSAWRRAHEKARVPYRIPYTLRHTRAAELLSQGALPALAARELGHSTQMFLTTYSEFIDEYSDQDLDVLEGVRHQIDPKGDVSP
jgi:integrase